jgi:hypothetical protein
MLLAEFLTALIISLAISGLFALIFGLRHTQGNKGLSSFLLLFVVVFLAAWAGGLWITPFGPAIQNVHWLPYLITAIMFGLLVIAVLRPQKSDSKVQEVIKEKDLAEKKSESSMGAVLWIFILLLIVAVIVNYST